MGEASDRVTVKVAFAALSSEVVTSLMLRDGLSSSVMVKVAVASEIVALLALESVIVTVSLVSMVVSAKIATLKVLLVSPGLNVSVVADTAV